MSITISDCLRLPSLSRATVVAGAAGLQQQVASVSVLEWLDETAEPIFYLIRGELVLTSFHAFRHDLHAQLRTLRSLQAAGEIGLILYYVGVVMQELSPELLQLADELAFPVICMPVGELSHRYSEAIAEISFLIYQDQMNDAHLVQDLLQRFSAAPERHRTIHNLLRILSDRLRVSVILTDDSGFHSVAALWPITLALNIRAVLEQVSQLKSASTSLPEILIEQAGEKYYLHLLPLKTRRQLLLLSGNQPVRPELQVSAVELLSTMTHLWSPESPENYGSLLLEALVKEDERQLRYAAQKLGLNPGRLQHLLLFHLDDEQQETHAPALPIQTRLLQLSRQFMEAEHLRGVVHPIGGQLVILLEAGAQRDLEAEQSELGHLVQTWLSWLQGVAPDMRVCFVPFNLSTLEIRTTYFQFHDHMATARKIYPLKQVYSGADLRMARQVQQAFQEGESRMLEALRPIRRLDQLGRHSAQLVQTLAAYLLDCDSRLEATASQLDLHVGTVKYRLKRVRQMLGEDIYQLPHVTELYFALALSRLAHKQL